ncbi:MAG: stage III sporulation protein AB [Defluviitaleaceae bacterium]|nr:stage III sporulation protein AB [Defluviitaleaceae bacterium]
MTWQIMGGVLVCASTTLLGLHLGGAGRRRTKDLLEFKKSLILLKSQIDFAIYTLPQAFSHIGDRTAAPFDKFYEHLAVQLDEGGADAATVWENGLQSLKYSNLTKEDLDGIAILGASLGHMDANVQINSIDMVIAGIDESLSALAADAPKTAKMYRGLGVVSGLLITIVLL